MKKILPVQFWAAVDSGGNIDLDSLSPVKREVRIGKKKMADGWTVELIEVGAAVDD